MNFLIELDHYYEVLIPAQFLSPSNLKAALLAIHPRIQIAVQSLPRAFLLIHALELFGHFIPQMDVRRSNEFMIEVR